MVDFHKLREATSLDIYTRKMQVRIGNSCYHCFIIINAIQFKNHYIMWL